jgi:predicted amidophosphoribosyltransferase
MNHISRAILIGLTALVTARTIRYRRRARMWRREMKLDEGICPDCGYDIRFTPERCPECGLKIVRLPEVPNPNAECPNCGEEIPHDLDRCPFCKFGLKSPS